MLRKYFETHKTSSFVSRLYLNVLLQYTKIETSRKEQLIYGGIYSCSEISETKHVRKFSYILTMYNMRQVPTIYFSKTAKLSCAVLVKIILQAQQHSGFHARVFT